MIFVKALKPAHFLECQVPKGEKKEISSLRRAQKAPAAFKPAGCSNFCHRAGRINAQRRVKLCAH